MADCRNRETAYTPRPFQDGTFSWEGNRHITSIVPVEVTLRFSHTTNPKVRITSQDVRQTLQDEDWGFDLASGELVHIKLRSIVEVNGEPETITFSISPPDISDLAQKKHAHIISAYLRENEVEVVWVTG